MGTKRRAKQQSVTMYSNRMSCCLRRPCPFPAWKPKCNPTLHAPTGILTNYRKTCLPYASTITHNRVANIQVVLIKAPNVCQELVDGNIIWSFCHLLVFNGIMERRTCAREMPKKFSGTPCEPAQPMPCSIIHHWREKRAGTVHYYPNP